MTVSEEVVFLLDVDNTLLDNDHIGSDLSHHLAQEFGGKTGIDTGTFLRR